MVEPGARELRQFVKSFADIHFGELEMSRVLFTCPLWHYIDFSFSVCLCLCLSVCLSVSVSVSVCLSVCLSVCMSLSLSLKFFFSFPLYVSFSVYLFRSLCVNFFSLVKIYSIFESIGMYCPPQKRKLTYLKKQKDLYIFALLYLE